MSAVTITADNFEKEVVKSNIPVLVDFWASWCGPCRLLSPTVEQVAEEHAGTLKVGKVNVDEQPDLAAVFKIASIPTLILFRDGKAVKVSVGLQPKAGVEAMLK